MVSGMTLPNLYMIRVAAEFTPQCPAASLSVTGRNQPVLRGGGLMDPIILSALTALISMVIRAIAFAELLARLRWQERQQRTDRSTLTELARTLPPGCRLDEQRADGSKLHLETARTVKPAERPST
jgi:hypothetical protein